MELRLALPNTSAIQSVAKNDKVKLFQWNINDAKTLIPAYRGCDAILMVPPIQNRLKVGCEYLRAAISADVQYICCLGVQPINPNLILERESRQLESQLLASGVKYSMLELPIFLENLLYQANLVYNHNYFAYPCRSDAAFSYLTCHDLGEVVAENLMSEHVLTKAVWTSASMTTFDEICSSVSYLLGHEINFRQVSTAQFINSLKLDGFTEYYATGITQLWRAVDAGFDIRPNKDFTYILGRPTMTVEYWLEQHISAFKQQPSVFPMPPHYTMGL